MISLNVITPLPAMFDTVLNESILLKAKQKNIAEYNIFNLFNYLDSSSERIDDYPFGGGEGMILKAKPIFDAVKDIKSVVGNKKKYRVIFPTPDGKIFNHSKAKELSKESNLIFICGHYKGIDQRIRDEIVTDEISIGDFVLTGGELPTMIMIDSIIRLKKGVLNNYESAYHKHVNVMMSDNLSVQEFLGKCVTYKEDTYYVTKKGVIRLLEKIDNDNEKTGCRINDSNIIPDCTN